MKTRFLLLIGILIFLGMSQFEVFAACDPTKDALEFLKDCSNDTQGVVDNSGGDVDAVKNLVTKVAERALQFGALFAIGAIVWSGIKYNTAYGDDERIKSAKTTAIYAVIGLVLMLSAFPFVDILINFVYSFSS